MKCLTVLPSRALRAACIYSVVILQACSAAEASDHYSHAAVALSSSQDNTWQAIVDEATCEAGPYSSDITATVLVGPAHARSKGVSVLGVDTGGHNEDRPRLAWSGPNTLDVTVPNLSFLKVLTLTPGSVHVRVHFDPDDPAARSAWLKEHHLAAD